MKNCPWFSLRSNSIESRFRSIRGQFFGSSRYDFEKKQKQDQKQLGIRFAHEFFARFARSRSLFSSCGLFFFDIFILKNCFSEGLGAIFCMFDRRHSL